MSTDLLTTIEDGIATVTFNRPDLRNAISTEMVRGIETFVASLQDRGDVRCLVFRGAGDHFSGGGDVRNFSTTLEASPEDRQAQYRDRVLGSKALFEQLEALPIPVVAVVRGAAAGAGLGFTLAADIAIASESAFFLVAHGRLGIALDTALSYFLPRAIGLRRAKELTLLGERVDATKALDYGIVYAVVPDAELDAAADKLIASLAKGATQAHNQSKRLLQNSFLHSVGEQVVLEAEAVGLTAASDDFIEGVSSFLERRPSRFIGR